MNGLYVVGILFIIAGIIIIIVSTPHLNGGGIMAITGGGCFIAIGSMEIKL
jgi:hypothetical protein